jgi:hypothetical protein
MNFKIRLSKIKGKKSSQTLVDHTCNLSYSGGRDLEDHDSKPAQANSSRHPLKKKNKKPITKKRAAGVA